MLHIFAECIISIIGLGILQALEIKALMPPGLVFCLAVSGVLQDSCDGLASLTLYGQEEKKSCFARLCRYMRSLQTHVEIKLYERTITHPRFVLRYSLTLTLTFLLGWLGVANVIAPYSSGPASTVAVIIYTFTGASLPLTLRRFNGVLLGKILGSVAQRLLAVQTLQHAVCFGLFQLSAVMALVFLSWHSKKHGGVCLLTAAYAMSELIPENGLFREKDTRLTSEEGSFLFVTMVGTFLGVAVLLVVDLILASSAKKQAKQRLLRGIRRVSKFVGQVLDPSDDPMAPIDPEQPEREEYLEKLQAKIYEDLSLSEPTCQPFKTLFELVSSRFRYLLAIKRLRFQGAPGLIDHVRNELQLLLPYAADETGLDGRSFPTLLGQDLEKGLRTVARHFRIIHWAIQLLEQPRKQATRRQNRV